jgi:hypothetical protein
MPPEPYGAPMSDAAASARAMPAPSPPVGHHGGGIPEPSGVETSRVVLAVGGAFMLLVIGIGGLGSWYWYEVPVQTVPPPVSFPQPRVQADEPAELRRLLGKQRQELTAYGWTDQQHTLLQIPIERAMKLIAAKGAHAYDPIAADAGALSSPEAGAERAMTPSVTTPNAQSSPPAAGPHSENVP